MNPTKLKVEDEKGLLKNKQEGIAGVII